MKKITLLTLGISLLMLVNAIAQEAKTTDCKADFCFNSASFKGYAARFTDKTKQLVVALNGKDKYTLPIPNGTSTADLLTLVQANKKITATEILFIAEALKGWQTELPFIGTTKHESGYSYKVIEQGTGPKPEKGNKVTVHYKGMLTDGRVFDSSFDRGEPATFAIGVGQLIRGWDLAIPNFNEGTRFMLILPPNLAYGANGAGGMIPPNATLIFEIQLIKSNAE